MPSSRTRFSGNYLLALAAILLLGLLASGFYSQTSNNRKIEARYSALSKAPAMGDFILIGDSLTQMAGQFFSGECGIRPVNYGVYGARLHNALANIDLYRKSGATRGWLMIGVNDIRDGRSIEAIQRDYWRLVEGLRERGLDLVLLQNIRVMPNYENSSEINQAIDQLNSWVARKATSAGIPTIELDSRIPADHYHSDGLHIANYSAWAAAVSPTLTKALCSGQRKTANLQADTAQFEDGQNLP